MKTRTLGKNLQVSAIGYGAMGLSFGYGHPPTKKGRSRSFARRSSAA